MTRKTTISIIKCDVGSLARADDPVMIVRGQYGLPAIGEILVPFMHTYLVEGWTRGSHWGPIMPVSFQDSKYMAFDGPPRLVPIGFQVANGHIACDDNMKPMMADLFDDPAFEPAREEAVKIGLMLRRMGEFEPARLGPEEMEYTTLHQVLPRLKERFKPA